MGFAVLPDFASSLASFDLRSQNGEPQVDLVNFELVVGCVGAREKLLVGGERFWVLLEIIMRRRQEKVSRRKFGSRVRMRGVEVRWIIIDLKYG